MGEKVDDFHKLFLFPKLPYRSLQNIHPHSPIHPNSPNLQIIYYLYLIHTSKNLKVQIIDNLLGNSANLLRIFSLFA